MQKFFTSFLFIVLWAAETNAQQILKDKDTSVIKSDSLIFEEARQNLSESISTITLDETELNNTNSQNFSSALITGKDAFYSVAAHNFSIAKFKIRGYDADFFDVNINGIPINDFSNGNIFLLLNGEAEVFKNRNLSIGLNANNFTFGNLGSAMNVDARASKNYKQTKLSYIFSNRNYTHKISFNYNSGILKHGWALSLSANHSWSDEGYVAGTYYGGWNAFIGIDKKFGKKNLISLIAFGTITEYGKQGLATDEAFNLSGSHFYNPYWGYQNGKKRNASISSFNQPAIILTYEFKIRNKTNLTTAISYFFGDNGSTAIDWYHAANPSPDYYQYMPGFYTDNSAQFSQILSQWKNNEDTRQINWRNFYAVNKISNEIVNGVSGFRSHYILSEAVNHFQQINFNTVFNSTIGKHTTLTAGLSYQLQQNNFYKKILDLLGGDYYVDLNQFAELSYPNNPSAAQPDLNNPNHVVYKNDRYQYDYNMNINQAKAWLQTVFKFNKWDFFIAGELSNTSFWRTGNMKNGLFPDNSFGKGKTQTFTNYAVKSGITFKINGRNFLYANGTFLTKAPLYENVYFSARTRDDQQNNINNENIISAEAGYVLNAPFVKLRITGYYTEINNQLNVLSFYDDAYNNLVNYAINHISKQLYGIEIGIRSNVWKGLSLEAIAAVGRYYYNSRQYATITLDNNATTLSNDTIYANGYRIGNTPQEVYSLGISYQSKHKHWFFNLDGNCINQYWLNINPIRRSYAAIINTLAGSAERNAILAQQQFNAQFWANFSASYSCKIHRKSKFRKKAIYLVFTSGINNLFNNQNIISSAFEQLRFDFDTNNPNKFPAKYAYAYGLTYFINTTFKF